MPDEAPFVQATQALQMTIENTWCLDPAGIEASDPQTSFPRIEKIKLCHVNKNLTGNTLAYIIYLYK